MRTALLTNSATARLTLVALIASICTIVCVQPVLAQSPDSLRKHATLYGWFESKRLFILNQAENYGGANYKRDLFREHLPEITPEHELDLLTYGYTAFQDYQWYNLEEGFRANNGSLNATVYGLRSQIKFSSVFKERHHVQVQVFNHQTIRTQRALVHLRYIYDINSSHSIGAENYADDNKSDFDITFIYRYSPTKDLSMTGRFTWLDFSHNTTQNLAEESTNEYNAAYNSISRYRKQPLLFDFETQYQITPSLRSELLVSYMKPSEKETVGILNDDHILDRSQAHLAGALLEYARPEFTIGTTFQRQFSKLRRIPFADSETQDDYTTTQWTNTIGIYGATSFYGFDWSQFIWYEFNVDQLYGKQVPDDLRPVIYDDLRREFDFRERRWKVKGDLSYPVDIWFNHVLEPMLSLHIDNRNVLMDRASNGVVGLEFRQIYPIVRDRSERLTLTFIYKFTEFNSFTAGMSYDIDGDEQSGYGAPKLVPSETIFDGGFLRVNLAW